MEWIKTKTFFQYAYFERFSLIKMRENGALKIEVLTLVPGFETKMRVWVIFLFHNFMPYSIWATFYEF